MKNRIQRLLSNIIVLSLLMTLAPAGYAVSPNDFQISIVYNSGTEQSVLQNATGHGGIYAGASNGNSAVFIDGNDTVSANNQNDGDMTLYGIYAEATSGGSNNVTVNDVTVTAEGTQTTTTAHGSYEASVYIPAYGVQASAESNSNDTTASTVTAKDITVTANAEASAVNSGNKNVQISAQAPARGIWAYAISYAGEAKATVTAKDIKVNATSAASATKVADGDDDTISAVPGDIYGAMNTARSGSGNATATLEADSITVRSSASATAEQVTSSDAAKALRTKADTYGIFSEAASTDAGTAHTEATVNKDIDVQLLQDNSSSVVGVHARAASQKGSADAETTVHGGVSAEGIYSATGVEGFSFSDEGGEDATVTIVVDKNVEAKKNPGSKESGI